MKKPKFRGSQKVKVKSHPKGLLETKVAILEDILVEVQPKGVISSFTTSEEESIPDIQSPLLDRRKRPSDDWGHRKELIVKAAEPRIKEEAYRELCNKLEERFPGTLHNGRVYSMYPDEIYSFIEEFMASKGITPNE